MHTLLADLRFAWRSLLKAPGFTAATVATLGLGIALVLSATTVTRAYLLQALPYPAAERLFWIRYDAPDVPVPQAMERIDWTALQELVEHRVAWDLDMFYVLSREGAQPLAGTWVTPGFVEALGITPALGRGLSAEAFRTGGPNEALIAHRVWQETFGGAPDIVGRTFRAYVSDREAEAEQFTIVGVLPSGFWHVNRFTDVMAPLRAPNYPYVARLRPGVPPDAVAQRVTALVKAGALRVHENWSARVVSVHWAYVQTVRPTLRAVLAASAVVLLVACANVAALLLVRGSERRREVSIRAALGAGRWAIARLLATEALLLGALAAGVALLATSYALDALSPLVQQQLGRPAPGGSTAFAIDWTLAGFALGVGLATALACALAPLAALVRPQVLAADGRSRTATEGRAAQRFRSGLIALEVAASLALLALATLMLRSAHELAAADLGVSTDRVLTGATTLRHARYPDATSRAAVFERLRTRFESLPAVEAAAFATMWPLQEPQLRELQAGAGTRRTRAAVQAVSTGYFDVLGIRVHSGRAFTPADRTGAERVVVVSQTLARRLWPDAEPIGATVIVAPAEPDEPPQEAIVVGVVDDVWQGPGDREQADAYVPLLQDTGNFAFALVRTPGPPSRAAADVRAAVREVDPEISIASVAPLEEVADRAVAGTRFLARLLTGFAVAATLVALVGVLGAVAYAVRQREREIAVRMAIGAEPSRIVRQFLWQGAAVVGLGVVVGIAGAVAGGRVIQSQLFNVSPHDPLALAGAAAVFGAAALLAIWWPARRAAATDPALTLRDE